MRKEAKANGAKVIAITRAVESKLAAEADYVLPVAATELIHRSGAMSSRISQLNVVDVLFTAYVNRELRVLHESVWQNPYTEGRRNIKDD